MCGRRPGLTGLLCLFHNLVDDIVRCASWSWIVSLGGAAAGRWHPADVVPRTGMEQLHVKYYRREASWRDEGSGGQQPLP